MSGLDGALAEFESGLGARWRDTVIVVATEFGRTARINGTQGTDHGTGTIALLAGGAVKGGRVISDWPGLKPANLYQGRDLAPTTDLRAVMKGVLKDQFGLAERVLAESVFPDSSAVKPMQDWWGDAPSFRGASKMRTRNLEVPGSSFGRPGTTTLLHFVIPSISAISSALSVQPIAFTFCSTCSTRVAPAMTLETCGRAASQEKASSSMLWPRLSRTPAAFRRCPRCAA